MRALILVDLQYDFCPGGALAVPHGDDAVSVANRLMPHFSHVVATQDWHPADHHSFAKNNPGTNVGDIIEIGGAPQVMWPPHCVQETYGAELHHQLDQTRIEEIVRKGTDPAVDSYSGFFDNLGAHATGLEDWLRARWITRVYVMGLATDYCVKFTALDARKLGFDVWLVEDGCRAVDRNAGDGDRAVAELREAGVTIVESGSIGP